MKKLATAIEVQKGPGMDIDDVEYRWVDDRINMLEDTENPRKTLTRAELSQANEMWSTYR